MEKVIDRADSRGHSVHSWLDSYHTFSFDEYYNPERMHFGALRVLNDDTVAPGKGFGSHPHKNMEVVSIPLKGKLQHGDSKMNDRIITPGDIQVMSAGTGIFHSEMNGSQEEPVEFLQIWIVPRERETYPIYQDFDIRPLLKRNELVAVVSPDGTSPASVIQDAWFCMGEFDAGKSIRYELHKPHHGVYIFVIEGEAGVVQTHLYRRDGIGIWKMDEVEIQALTHAHLLLIEVPMFE
ncbi:MAG: pirin family protein [Bacteroides sp.]|nr:pirin family protein [Bacteroides sp.]